MHDAAADSHAGPDSEREAGTYRARAEPERRADNSGSCTDSERGTYGRSDHARPGADTLGGADCAGTEPERQAGTHACSRTDPGSYSEHGADGRTPGTRAERRSGTKRGAERTAEQTGHSPGLARQYLLRLQ